MSRKQIHVYFSDMRFETRIFKTSETLRDNGIAEDIILLGRTDRRGDRAIQFADRIHIRKLYMPFFQSSRILKAMYFFIWNLWVLLVLIRERPDFLNIHSAALLPFAGISRFLSKKCRIIYDAHELETETNNLSGPARLYKSICERVFLRFCHHVFVVSPMIRDWYSARHNIKNISVLLNAPIIRQQHEHGTDVRKKFNLSESDFIIAYVGLLAKGRGIDLMLDMAQNSGSRFKFLFIGFGPEESLIRTDPRFGKKVFFLPPEPQGKLLKTLEHVDFGFSYYLPNCLSLDMSLPNKFFEYLTAGIPVIVGPCRQLRQIISDYKVGIVAESPMNIEKVLKELEQFADSDCYKSEIQRFLSDFNWQKNSDELTAIYKKLS